MKHPQSSAFQHQFDLSADYGVDVAPRLQIVSTTEPEARAAGVMVGSVEELVTKLKDEAGVI